MATTEINNSLIEGYMQLLSGLTEKGKKMLIQRLQASVKTGKKNEDFFASYGAWVGDESAEELIELIGATAVANQLTMVTNNVGEFSRIKNIDIEDWTKEV